MLEWPILDGIGCVTDSMLPLASDDEKLWPKPGNQPSKATWYLVPRHLRSNPQPSGKTYNLTYWKDLCNRHWYHGVGEAGSRHTDKSIGCRLQGNNQYGRAMRNRQWMGADVLGKHSNGWLHPEVYRLAMSASPHIAMKKEFLFPFIIFVNGSGK